ncbi:SIMPL domain-containing protein [Marilutibacter spongiae]|uniref:SIMPL domain-containing protein n=1 Tax=Marilutibacter spongiae TaxID=2025720 RepID=A0A7W3TKE9_9GAMM|nr:SIMPL domain-containing protein [Lysobacter spongiae]MBB1059933.1 SIMPL domain-containing protein [Lysobacter spongiae]
MRLVPTLVLYALLYAALPPAHAGTPLPDGPHIVASGTGEVDAKPDRVRVTFRFSARQPAPLAAKQQVDAGVARLLATLPGFGIGDADVTASDLDAAEDVDYDDEGRRISHGYLARREVTATLHDLDRFNALLDGGLAAGATAISQVEFESSQAPALRQQAKVKAVEDARREASEVARSFGATLGPVYSVDSANARFSAGYGARSLDRITVTGSRLPAPGRYLQPRVSYAASVTAVFELER